MKQIRFELSDGLHAELKQICAINKITMRGALISLIEKYTEPVRKKSLEEVIKEIELGASLDSEGDK